MNDHWAIRNRAEHFIAYGSHAEDIGQANEEVELLGRDILALLAENEQLRRELNGIARRAWTDPVQEQAVRALAALATTCACQVEPTDA